MRVRPGEVRDGYGAGPARCAPPRARAAGGRAGRRAASGDPGDHGQPVGAGADGAADARRHARDGADVRPGRRRLRVRRGWTVRHLLGGDAGHLLGCRRHTETLGDDGGAARVPAAPVRGAPPGPPGRRTPAHRARLPAPRAGAAVVHGGQSPALGAAPDRRRLRRRPGRPGSAAARHPAGRAGHPPLGGSRAAHRRRAATLPGRAFGGAGPAGGAVAARFRPGAPARRGPRWRSPTAGPRAARPARGVPRPHRPGRRGLRRRRAPAGLGMGEVAAARPAPHPGGRAGRRPPRRRLGGRADRPDRRADRAAAPVHAVRHRGTAPAGGPGRRRTGRGGPAGRGPRHRRHDPARPGRPATPAPRTLHGGPHRHRGRPAAHRLAGRPGRRGRARRAGPGRRRGAGPPAGAAAAGLGRPGRRAAHRRTGPGRTARRRRPGAAGTGDRVGRPPRPATGSACRSGWAPPVPRWNWT